MVHIPLMLLSEWREFPSAPCLAGKKNLMTAGVSMLLKSRASPGMLPFSLCNKKRLAIRHMNRPLFPTTLSIPSYVIGKQVGLRTYQQPLVQMGLSLSTMKQKETSCCKATIDRGFGLVFEVNWADHFAFLRHITCSCTGNRKLTWLADRFKKKTGQLKKKV